MNATNIKGLNQGYIENEAKKMAKKVEKNIPEELKIEIDIETRHPQSIIIYLN